MSDDTIMTLVGHLTADPELRYTPSGVPVANLTVASTPRFFDRQANEWRDGETLFVRCSMWRELAENVSESLRKGHRVIAQGRLKARSFEDKEANRRTAWELDVDEIGPSLKKATAQVQKTTGGQSGGFNAGPQSTGGSWGSSNTYDATQSAGWGQPAAAGWPADDPAF